MKNVQERYSDAKSSVYTVIKAAGRLNGRTSAQLAEPEENHEIIKTVIKIAYSASMDGNKSEREWTLNAIGKSAAHLLEGTEEEQSQDGYSPQIFLKNSEGFISLLKKLADDPLSVKKPYNEIFPYSLIK